MKKVLKQFANQLLEQQRTKAEPCIDVEAGKYVVDGTGRNMVNEARSTSRWMNIGNGKNRNRGRNISNSARWVK
ncbi:MAG TPA: hypothetical protein PKI14_09455 [Fervidobacterium sp.]|uniref:hypothetical protein n=1 Tax=Acetomicrobium mobile TaxID=97477 RepID=UPI0026E938DE|nr:hypothetical protein [Acetomicrobium mobile]HUM43161.1 hypothetical protein [Fervidobacterium sp.]